MTAPLGSPQNPTQIKIILFLTIFIAMLGLSILFPVIAPLARELGLTESQAGWFATAFSLAQFIFSPMWGKRSEKVGRKPVLIIGLVGFSLSFGLFGILAEWGFQGVLSTTFLFVSLVISRLLGGWLSSATFPTAQAMMADISSEQDRTASMGLIGAAFGLGLIFGPALGAVLSAISLLAPVYFSTILGLLTALLAWFILPETRRADQQPVPKGSGRALLGHPMVLLFLVVNALVTLASVAMEQTLGFYVQDNLSLSAEQTIRVVGSLLVIFGVVTVVVQGGLLRVLSRKVKPSILLTVGLLLMTLGMAILAQSSTFLLMGIGLGVLGTGTACVGPSISSALSLAVSADQQGTVAGLNSSAMALGRLTGPLISTGLYQYIGHSAPYWVSTGVLLILLILMVISLPKLQHLSSAKG